MDAVVLSFAAKHFVVLHCRNIVDSTGAFVSPITLNFTRLLDAFFVAMAAAGFNSHHMAHDVLPMLAVAVAFSTIHRVGNQMGNFVWDGTSEVDVFVGSVDAHVPTKNANILGLTGGRTAKVVLVDRSVKLTAEISFGFLECLLSGFFDFADVANLGFHLKVSID